MAIAIRRKGSRQGERSNDTWQQQAGPDGTPYYYNKKTGETTQVNPGNVVNEDLNVWAEHVAPDGRPYWHNSATGATQWTNPLEGATNIPIETHLSSWTTSTRYLGSETFY